MLVPFLVAADLAAPTTIVAGFTSNITSGSTPTAVQFTGNPTSFCWNYSDGTTGSGKTPVKSYTKAGVYTVSLVAYNAATSNSTTKTSLNAVGAAPIIAGSTANMTAGPVPLAVQFSEASTGTPTGWYWVNRPQMRVYARNGTLTTEATGDYYAGTNPSEITKTVADTGTYKVLAMDCLGDQPDSYDFYLQQM